MAQQWLSASDPFFSQSPGTYDESGYVYGPYDSMINGLQSPQNWEMVAPQLGWTGPTKENYIGPDGNVYEKHSDDFLRWISSKQAEGYDFVTDASTLGNYNQRFGFRLPSGEVTNQRVEKVGDFGEIFKQFVLPAVGAYFGAGFLGNALAPVTNALTGGVAAGGGAGAALAGGIAEGMAPGVLAPASAAELGAVNALTGAGGTLTAADLADLSTNVMGSGGNVVAADLAASDGFLGGMSETAATEGAGVAGTGILTKGTNIPSAVLGGGDLLDKALKFIQTPAGGAIVSGVGNVVGGIAAGSAAKDAAQTQAASADAATQLQRDIYNKFMEMNKPYYEAGVNALGQITRGEVTAEPGYGFRLGEGMKALERLQASRGNLLSGGAMKAGQRYAQDLASEEYGKSFNRLANIAGIGQTAASQAGTAGQNYAGQAGELGMQGANALVSGRIGRTSAYTGGMQGAINALQGYQQEQQRNQLMRDIFGRLGG
jgi:hypothetical protein